MKYQKKPVVIEAMEWNGYNGMEIIRWANEIDPCPKNPTFHFVRRNQEEEPNGHDLYELRIMTMEGEMIASIGDMIICGVNGEFYPCKPDIFAKTYDPAKKESGYTFGEAIEMMKNGKRMSRRGWNGKRQYIELATCISYKNPDGEIVNAEHAAIGNKAIAFVGTSGVQMGWLASQADMLAEDWEVYGPQPVE